MQSYDEQHLPVPRFGAPWFLHLCIQSVHQVPFSWALGSGIESQTAFIGWHATIQQLVITSKCPMEILDFSIVAFSSLPFPKFSSFGLDPVKLQQCWSRRNYSFSMKWTQDPSSSYLVGRTLFHAVIGDVCYEWQFTHILDSHVMP